MESSEALHRPADPHAWARVAGRDAQLPPWLHKGANGAPARPRYDSVVVRGNGIGASVFAARLARSEEFSGRVVLAGAPVSDNRRLIGGLTLRARALDYYSAAFGRSPQALLEQIFGETTLRAASDRQLGAYCAPRGDGSFEVHPPQSWLSSKALGNGPLCYGVRNSHLASCLEQAAIALGAVRVGGDTADVDACRALAPGKSPLIVNASSKPLRPRKAAPKAFVAAVQRPLAARGATDIGILGNGASLFGATLRDGRNDIHIFNPIADPRSPSASYYGITYRIVRARPEPNRERELDSLRSEHEGVSTALGFEAVDAAETEGAAMLPCSPWNYDGRMQDDVLELSQVYDAGCPIITGDGMTRAGIAGWVAAEAVLAGEDPVPHANRALAQWRAGNRKLSIGMTWGSRIAAFAIRRSPGRVLAAAAEPDTWSGIDRKEARAQ